VVGHKDVVAIGFGDLDPELSEVLAEALEEAVRVVVVAWGHDGDSCDLLHVGSVRLGTQKSRRSARRMLDAMQALLGDGPLQGTTVEVEAVEGRPPKTVEVPDDKGGVCRYCLAEWTQEGMTAAYTFLYAV
jgi:hypothetical protein